MGENMKFCTSCGAELQGALKFCGQCGHPVSASNKSSQKSNDRPHSADAHSNEFLNFVDEDTVVGWTSFIEKARDIALPANSWADAANRKYGPFGLVDDEDEIATAKFGTLWVKRFDYDGPDVDLSSVVPNYAVPANNVMMLIPVDAESIDFEEDEVWISKKNWAKDFDSFGEVWYFSIEINCPRCLLEYESRTPTDEYYPAMNATPECPACGAEGYLSLDFDSSF